MARSKRNSAYNSSKERVIKCRRLAKLRNAYQKSIQDEVNKREESDRIQSGEATVSSNLIPNTNDYNDEVINFKEQIMCWTVKHAITQRALNDLLAILIVFGLNFLPKDSRTFMNTPTTVNITNLSKGRLWYHGIKTSLDLILKKMCYSDVQRFNTIHLDFNFDGVELFKSSKTCFWPMIASIRGKPFNFHYSVLK